MREIRKRTCQNKNTVRKNMPLIGLKLVSPEMATRLKASSKYELSQDTLKALHCLE